MCIRRTWVFATDFWVRIAPQRVHWNPFPSSLSKTISFRNSSTYWTSKPEISGIWINTYLNLSKLNWFKLTKIGLNLFKLVQTSLNMSKLVETINSFKYVLLFLWIYKFQYVDSNPFELFKCVIIFYHTFSHFEIEIEICL